MSGFLLFATHGLYYLSAFGILDDCSGGHVNNHIRAVRTVKFCALSVSAVFGNKLSSVSERKEGIRSLVYSEDYVSASSPVTAVGSAV